MVASSRSQYAPPVRFGMEAEGIFGALEEGTRTMHRGGGVGYDFSTLRPQGTSARANVGLPLMGMLRPHARLPRPGSRNASRKSACEVAWRCLQPRRGFRRRVPRRVRRRPSVEGRFCLPRRSCGDMSAVVPRVGRSERRRNRILRSLASLPGSPHKPRSFPRRRSGRIDAAQASSERCSAARAIRG